MNNKPFENEIQAILNDEDEERKNKLSSLYQVCLHQLSLIFKTEIQQADLNAASKEFKGWKGSMFMVRYDMSDLPPVNSLPAGMEEFIPFPQVQHAYIRLKERTVPLRLFQRFPKIKAIIALNVSTKNKTLSSFPDYSFISDPASNAKKRKISYSVYLNPTPTLAQPSSVNQTLNSPLPQTPNMIVNTMLPSPLPQTSNSIVNTMPPHSKPIWQMTLYEISISALIGMTENYFFDIEYVHHKETGQLFIHEIAVVNANGYVELHDVYNYNDGNLDKPYPKPDYLQIPATSMAQRIGGLLCGTLKNKKIFGYGLETDNIHIQKVLQQFSPPQQGKAVRSQFFLI